MTPPPTLGAPVSQGLSLARSRVSLPLSLSSLSLSQGPSLSPARRTESQARNVVGKRLEKRGRLPSEAVQPRRWQLELNRQLGARTLLCSDEVVQTWQRACLTQK